MSPTGILVVANRTASTPQLLDEIGRRARDGARFTLLIPPEHGHAGADDWTADSAAAAARPRRRRARRADRVRVATRSPRCTRRSTPASATRSSSRSRRRISRSFVHHDLRHRLEHLGMPVTVIPPEPDVPLPGHVRDALPDDWYTAQAIPGGGGDGELLSRAPAPVS